MNRSNDPDSVVQFAGLTRHNNVDMGNRAASIAGMDSDDTPDTSFSQAIRELETADVSETYWQVPDSAAAALDVGAVNSETPDGIELVETTDGDVLVHSNRFQSVISPDKISEWVQGNHRNNDGEFKDALWNVPTSNYSITNPTPFYRPFEEELREHELGDSMFGEIREYKGGGEVHMDILFDAFEVDVAEEEGGPIVLGIRTGYDFFGNTALYAEGYGQDTACDNSIRSITEEKSRRHIGEIEDTGEWWADILGQMELMTDALSEAIEAAQEIEVDYLEMNFSEAFNHEDDLRAFYELAGFPTYLATDAASNVRSRASNQFLPTCWELHSGATYAVTHSYRGGENTSRVNELIQVSNDMLMNPSQSIGTVERSYSQRLARQSEEASDAGELDGHDAEAVVEEFRDSVEQKREEFESRREQMEEMLIAPGAAEEEA